MVLTVPKEDIRRWLLAAYDAGMTNGDFVFYTIELLPQESVLNPEETWKGDSRNVESKQAFESVFHVSTSEARGQQSPF